MENFANLNNIYDIEIKKYKFTTLFCDIIFLVFLELSPIIITSKSQYPCPSLL